VEHADHLFFIEIAEVVVAKKESAAVFEDWEADAKVARASRKRRCGPR
jgi:hypothetical protein